MGLNVGRPSSVIHPLAMSTHRNRGRIKSKRQASISARTVGGVTNDRDSESKTLK